MHAIGRELPREENYNTLIPQTNDNRILLYASKGDVQGVTEMLDAGVSITTRDFWGTIADSFNKHKNFSYNQTALHFACVSDHVPVVQCLLERAKKAGNRLISYEKDSDEVPPLTVAIRNNALGCLNLLLESDVMDIRHFPSAPHDPFHCVHSWIQCIGRNPFLFAIYDVKEEAVAKMLWSVGKRSMGVVLDQHLLSFLHADLVDIVASYCIGNCGEYLNNFRNISPLELAKKISSKKIVELLIEAGAVDEVQEPPAKKQKTH